MYWHAVVLAPTRNRLCPHLLSPCSDSSATDISRRILSACSKSCSPACVSKTFLLILSKSRQPRSVSSAFIEWLTADCDRLSSRAATVKLPRRARVTKARSCLLSIGGFIDEFISFPRFEPRSSFFISPHNGWHVRR